MNLTSFLSTFKQKAELTNNQNPYFKSGLMVVESRDVLKLVTACEHLMKVALTASCHCEHEYSGGVSYHLGVRVPAMRTGVVLSVCNKCKTLAAVDALVKE